MGDDDEGQVEGALQRHQLELRVAAQFLVERRHRLVEQENARTLDERARQRDALALAAGQFMRLAAAQAFKPDHRQHVGNAGGDFAPAQAVLFQTEGNVGFDGKMREERVTLKHHVDRPPIRRHRRKIDAVEQDVADIRPLEARDQPQQRGLAAARRAEQSEEFAFINVERKLIDHGLTAEALGQCLDAQQRTQTGIGPRRKISFRAGDLSTLRCEVGILAGLFNAI